MKLLRPRTFVVFALVALSGVMLLYTSQNVQEAEGRRTTLEASIAREKEKIRMLRAEWEHLNRPERLEKLADEFLDLVPARPSSLMGHSADVKAQNVTSALGGEVEESPAQSTPISYKNSEKPLSSSASFIVRPHVKPSIAPPVKPPEKKAASAAKSFDDLLKGLGAGSDGGAP